MHKVLSAVFILTALMLNLFFFSIYSGIILICLFLILALNIGANFAVRKKINIEIKPVKSGEEKKSSSCVVAVSNQSRLPVFLKGALQVDNLYSGERGKIKIRLACLPGKTAEAEYLAENTCCGKVRCSIEKIGLTDIFDFTDVRIKKKAAVNYTVLPELFDMFIDYDQGESRLDDCLTYSQEKKGQDMSEVFQIREYVPGDSIRHIHWKLSSKLDTLLVKESALPVDKSLAVFWDKSTGASETDVKIKSRIVQMVISACQRLIEEAIPFEFVYGDREEECCITENITNQDEFARLIPRMLSKPMTKDGLPLSAIYEKQEGECRATHVIYITCNEQDEPERLFGGCRFVKLDARNERYKEDYRIVNLQ